MTTKQKFKSDAFAAIHASAAALQKVGAIDQTTMRQFDETCLAVPTTQRHGAQIIGSGPEARTGCAGINSVWLHAAGADVQWHPPFVGYTNHGSTVRIATTAAVAGFKPQNDLQGLLGFLCLYETK